MRTSGDRNGRPAVVGVAATGRPTCDAIYRAVADEYLRKFGLDGDEALAAGVARRFRESPAQVCCRAIGDWIDRMLSGLGWTQQDLADRVGVDRSAVARWTAGKAISLGHLVLVLIEFRSDFGELPLPARRELALEGYLAALTHVRARIDPGLDAGPMDRERFWCLYHLFAEPHWERAVRQGDRLLLEGETARIVARASESLGRPTRLVREIGDLLRLVEQWAAAWVICLHLVPRDWSLR
jgi:transcriptional regulator with XRE-family HTH domain